MPTKGDSPVGSSEVASFDIETAAQDFAAPGRSIEVKCDDFSSRPGSHFSERHIWIEVNGWTFSATWGSGTYSTAGRDCGAWSSFSRPTDKVSPNAEVAVWNSRDGETGRAEMIQIGDDNVEGWVSPTSLIAALEAAERDDEDGIRSALARRNEDGYHQ